MQILLANSKSGERCYKKGHFSPLSGKYESPFMLKKNRTSLQKANSPAVSDASVTNTAGVCDFSSLHPAHLRSYSCLERYMFWDSAVKPVTNTADEIFPYLYGLF
jgi:hypothetical protein